MNYSFKKIDIVNTLFLFLTPVTAIFLTYLWINEDGFHWGQVFLGILLYFVTGLSITAGYHRLFAHKAYDAHPLVKLFFLLFGAATFQNSILKWGSDHRLHHAKVDTEADPYSIQEGFFYAHMGWVLLKKNSDIKDKYAHDFYKDKLVMWQHKYYLAISIFVGLIFPALLGELLFNSWLGSLAVGGFCRVVLVHHCTFFINSLCHCLGSTPYTDTNSAKDSWFVALFTFGEGYHNFHHYFQVDYRNGIRWYHFDPTKWVIQTLRTFGLTFKLKRTPEDKILLAKMQMTVKRIELQNAACEQFRQEIEAMKVKVIEAFHNFQKLKEEYKATKTNELRQKILEAKAEFRKLLDAWNDYIDSLSVSPAIVRHN